MVAEAFNGDIAAIGVFVDHLLLYTLIYFMIQFSLAIGSNFIILLKDFQEQSLSLTMAAIWKSQIYKQTLEDTLFGGPDQLKMEIKYLKICFYN